MPSPDVAIQLNGDPKQVPHGCSVAELVVLLGLSARRVAVAINRNVVPRSTFANQRIAEGDRVEILEAVGGG